MIPPNIDIVIAGGGHAGVEAALAACRLGLSIGLVTMDPLSIGRMSCNPAIGGLGKGHLVQEIDALGGIMGAAADFAGIQFKVLNKSKGRAVWSLRAQVDKKLYPKFIQSVLAEHVNLHIICGEVVDFNVDKCGVSSVVLRGGTTLNARALVVCSGTFLRGLIHIGRESYPAGRLGEKPSIHLSESIINKGFVSARLKTGTPPRIDASTVDWEKTLSAPGDTLPVPFSQQTPLPFQSKNIPCHIVNTNVDVHRVLYDNLHHSPMFSGKISAIGPRYCPSIEDKVVRFKDRKQHQVFLEPEWINSNQIYVNGFSTSMPRGVQKRALQKIPALKNVDIIRPGYAIEYDFIPTWQLRSTLETKKIPGLYFAGQLNGTSGYEEAAAQGLIAGANAALKILGNNPLILKRSEAYIGVMIDDLITKDIHEPYRMFTSSAEHRLSLRGDNAGVRLTGLAYGVGLVGKSRHNSLVSFLKSISSIKKTCSDTSMVYKNKSMKIIDYIKRPEASLLNDNIYGKYFSSFSKQEVFTAETDMKYEGYVKIENARVRKLKSLENLLIPEAIDYASLGGLSSESQEKLCLVRPETLGQASRLAGVRPADVGILAVYIKS